VSFEPHEYMDRLRERTEQLAPNDAEHGFAHFHLSTALALALQRVAEIYDPDEGLPGAPLLDVDTCPDWALPWLAQAVGVILPPGTAPDAARALIKGVSGWQRGTPAALMAAVRMHLAGDLDTGTVFFRERDPDSDDPPYTLEIVTLDRETPDPDAVLAALMAQKPGGIVLKYRTVPGYDWQQVGVEHATWADVVGDYSTWHRLVFNEPG
jgi:hypothetical protein